VQQCVGAKERDPHRRCTSNLNPTMSPKKDDIGLAPATVDCRPTSEKPEPVCTFGAPAGHAKATIALAGDSHALHWRAAVEVVANAKHWRGYSVTTAACPYSAVVEFLPGGLREQCINWYRDARRWLRAHPEVSTLFVSQTTHLDASAPGRTDAQLKRAGYIRAWSTLPRTVKRVIVLRDVPDPADNTFDCLDQAIAAGMPRLGRACPTPRATALSEDPAVRTVRALHLKRYRAIDLSSLFCTPKNCYPAIGGLQVYADVFGHITAAYMRTVAPYLLRRLGG
jgi:hypothetical protein